MENANPLSPPSQGEVDLIDTHCHLDFPHFADDLAAVIARAQEYGVERMISIGCRLPAARRAIEISEVFPGVSAAVGIHPTDIEADFAKDFAEIEQLAEHKNVLAIGETGLDFFREENPSSDQQHEAFARHIELAKKLQKPVIIHLRSARKELEIFLSERHDFPFVIHCFSEDWAFAKQVFDWGGMISFTGIVTFKNADPSLLEVAQKAPLEKIMVETDAPFLAPEPQRGKRNEPAFTRHTAERLAELRGEDIAAFARQTTRNAERFFSI